MIDGVWMGTLVNKETSDRDLLVTINVDGAERHKRQLDRLAGGLKYFTYILDASFLVYKRPQLEPVLLARFPSSHRGEQDK
jgi:hypothetical protein